MMKVTREHLCFSVGCMTELPVDSPFVQILTILHNTELF